MKAVVQRGYGSPDVFELREVDRPALKDDEILVRVHAAALHAGDCFVMKGVPYVARFSAGWPKPRNYIPGYDAAGRVEAVGSSVTRFRPGDAVLGACQHTCAEYVCAGVNSFALKPANLTFAQAAAVPTSGTAALRGIRDAGKTRPGQKVLINGASGGVGTFAVQIAKFYGAEVTGVCSSKNVNLVRSIGADYVIDYTREDFTEGEQRFDLILDQVANRPLSACRRVLTPEGVHIPNSGNAGLGYILKALVVSVFMRQQGRTFIAIPNNQDLVTLKELIESGKVTPVIDKSYSLSETPEAFRYLDTGHARGKVVIAIVPESGT
jgi:NADPH:quinone reductase-like Zn-dependent oxidoreductase